MRRWGTPRSGEVAVGAEAVRRIPLSLDGPQVGVDPVSVDGARRRAIDVAHVVRARPAGIDRAEGVTHLARPRDVPVIVTGVVPPEGARLTEISPVTIADCG